jgi:hypothetical protein
MDYQATMWQAQLPDGSKLRGGQTNLYPDDQNVAVVPVELVKIFSISHNTFTHTYYVPLKTWYINGVPWVNRPATVTYGMQDGSLLTVTTSEMGQLTLSQE